MTPDVGRLNRARSHAPVTPATASHCCLHRALSCEPLALAETEKHSRARLAGMRMASSPRLLNASVPCVTFADFDASPSRSAANSEIPGAGVR